MENLLKDKPHIQKHLYEKGYLITTFKNIKPDVYPFYSNWNKQSVGSYDFWFHKGTKLFLYTKDELTFFLIGHSYNPFSAEIDENKILESICFAYGTDRYYDLISELNGIFILGAITNSGIEFMLDASGMQYGCYGVVDDDLFITSHMRLVGDLCDVKTDPYVEKLTGYRWFKYMTGNYLPGDLTCYKEIKRIVPNTCVKYNGNQFDIERFYPKTQIEMCKTEEEYNEVITQAAEILKNIMKLIPLKWERPSLSLTGGIDSNTAFAAANGEYDKYETFSYVSMHREIIDSKKAKEISDAFGVKHTEILVEDSNDDFEGFNIYKEVFKRNGGNLGTLKDNDARKKIKLIHSDFCDVEVKSWVSEIIRAYMYKYFGLKKMPKNLSARNYTSFYKIFLLNRKLVWQTDKHFAHYIKKYKVKESMLGRDESDFIKWEVMLGGKGGLDIGVMRSCFDIDIPYNNRKLMELLLRIPLEHRISDKHHLDIKKKLNEQLYNMNIRVVNENQGENRSKLIGLYWKFNSILPF